MKAVRLFYVYIFLILSISVGAQCTYNNTLTGTPISLACPASTTVTMDGGQYVVVNVTSGLLYTFSTCGNSGCDTQLTLFTSGGGTNLEYNDDDCGLQSTITWVSSFTGQVNLLLDEFSCANGCPGTSVSIACQELNCIGSGNSTCANADLFCTGAPINYCNTSGGIDMGAYDCLDNTPNPAWFYLNMQTSGNIDIFIEQTDFNGNGLDVDFALYGPYTSLAAGCANIGPGTIAIDCSFSPNDTETANITNGVAGEYYILLTTNYSDEPGQINYSQSGGVGSTDCSVLNTCSSTAVPTNIQCNGGPNGSILVTATEGTTDFEVSWTGTTIGDPAGPEITVIGGTFDITNLPAGSYDITVTDGAACVSNHTVSIIEPALLQASENHVNPSCFGNNVTATITATGGTAPYNVSWTGPSNGNPAGNEITVSGGTYNMTGLGMGTYNVTVTDASGCTAITTVDIVSATAMNISTNVTDVLCGGINSGAIDVTVSGGATPYQVSWTGPSSGNPAGNEITVSGGTYTINGLSGGNYNVTISDGNGCSGSLPINIASPTALNMSLSKTDVTCNGVSDGQVNSTVTGGTVPYTYTWSNGSTTANVSNLTVGNYCLTVTDGNGCSANACETITEPSALTLNFGVTNVSCNGVCDGTATATVAGGTPPYSYNWSGLAGNTATNVTAICDGIYDLVVTDAEGCSIDTLDWIVTEPIALTMSVTIVDETCFGICDGSLSIVSNTGVSFSINGGSVFSTNTNYTDMCTGIYNVIAEDQNGCQVTSNETISGPPEVDAYFTFGPQPANILNPAITFENHSTGAVSYLWDFGFTQSSDENPLIDFPDDTAGIYNVCLYAYNSDNCPDSICYDVIIDEDFAVYIPNSFTPNEDGMNDIFYVYGNDIDPEIYELMIFNRWGELIFETNDMYEGWDGTEGGLDVPIGIYIWKLKTEAKSQEKYFERIGHVNLFR